MEIKQIDKTDKQILHELDGNCRQSVKQIAKKLRKKRDTIAYRIRQLEKQETIQEYFTVIDYARIGYTLCRLYIRFQNTSIEKEEEIIAYLKDCKEIFTLYTAEGNWDLAIGFLVRSLDEYNDVVKNIQKKYNQWIRKYESAVFLEYVHFFKSYLVERQEGREISTGKQQKQERIDEKDIELLRLIAKNARMPLLDIAKKVKMTPMAVRYRIKQLEKKKIILGYRTLINTTQLGYAYYKIDFSIEDMSKLQKLRAFARQHPNIIFEDRTIGGSDFEVDAELEGYDALYSLIEEIKKQFPGIIRQYTYYKARKIYKYVYFPE